MSGLALSGLASGVDTSNIVDQLMSIERQKVTAIQKQQSSVTAHQSALKGVSDKLNALRTAGLALSDTASWKTTQTATSSDPSKVTVALLEGAGIGGHTIEVDRLASSAQHGFTYTASGAAGSILIGSASVSISANASLKDVASAINASTASPAVAAIVRDGDGTDRLVLSARKPGSGSDFTVTSGLLSEDAAYSRTGATLNAVYRVDGGTARTSETNAVESAIAGLRLTLTGITSGPVAITTDTPRLDKSAIGTKVKAFVDAYNAVVDVTRAQVGDKAGTLFGDRQLDSMVGSLKRTLQQTVTGVGSLSDIGISVPKATGGTTTDDAKAGKLTFDSKALDAALDKDSGAVQTLFAGVGARKGFGWLVSDAVNAQTGLRGVLTSRITSDGKRLTDFSKRIADTNERLTATEARLKSQFAAMEKALGNSQSQQAWLTGQINSLNGNRG